MEDRKCATKYPIMLIHGIGYQDDDFRRYWGRIPASLKKHGATVCFGRQDAFGSIRHNAEQLKISVQNALTEYSAEKLNLIAHSKGGIEARYLISCLGMERKIASLTTLATPHRGILSMDKMKEKAEGPYKVLLSLFNQMLLTDGGGKNRSLKTYEQMTCDYMKIFNEMAPDAESVYYQSYAFDMKRGSSDLSMSLFYYLIRRLEGPNDGLVSVESAKWGAFQGVRSGRGKYGISHPAAADSGKGAVRKRRKQNAADILGLYTEIAGRLKSMGY